MVRTLAICHSYLCSVAVCISLLVYLCVLFIYTSLSPQGARFGEGCLKFIFVCVVGKWVFN